MHITSRKVAAVVIASAAGLATLGLASAAHADVADSVSRAGTSATSVADAGAATPNSRAAADRSDDIAAPGTVADPCAIAPGQSGAVAQQPGQPAATGIDGRTTRDNTVAPQRNQGVDQDQARQDRRDATADRDRRTTRADDRGTDGTRVTADDRTRRDQGSDRCSVAPARQGAVADGTRVTADDAARGQDSTRVTAPAQSIADQSVPTIRIPTASGQILVPAAVGPLGQVRPAAQPVDQVQEPTRAGATGDRAADRARDDRPANLGRMPGNRAQAPADRVQSPVNSTRADDSRRTVAEFPAAQGVNPTRAQDRTVAPVTRDQDRTVGDRRVAADRAVDAQDRAATRDQDGRAAQDRIDDGRRVVAQVGDGLASLELPGDFTGN